jgi:hypothetical protein
MNVHYFILFKDTEVEGFYNIPQCLDNGPCFHIVYVRRFMEALI